MIHHFPLDIVSELNDIINSGFIVPNTTFADSVQWDSSASKYKFISRNNLNSATINNLLLGQTNNQPLNNLTICVTLNIIQWESSYAIFFKSGNIEAIRRKYVQFNLQNCTI